MRYLFGPFLLLSGVSTLIVLGLPLFFLYLMDEPRKYQRLERWFGLILAAAFGQWVTIDGYRPPTEHPGRGRLYLLFPHVSYLDAIVGAGVLREYATGVGAHNYFRWPVIGWIMGRRLIPINRAQTDQAVSRMCRLGKEELARGRAVIVAPQGTRGWDKTGGEFKVGAFHEALKTDCEIVVILIKGAYRSWPRRRIFPRPGRIKVRFSPPIRPEEYRRLSPADLRTAMEGYARKMMEQ